PEVVETMLHFLGDHYANPSSVHRFGQRVRHEVEVARERVAVLIGARPKEIVFTSGGTECINLAIRGLLRAKGCSIDGQGGRSRAVRPHIITSAVEHSAVRKVCDLLREEGCEVDELGVAPRIAQVGSRSHLSRSLFRKWAARLGVKVRS
ncbi:MAG: aminotransferase class V-fold PLP-dependent enzyme, partial [Acidobacteria bacterium]|nr:aminotransferase class V-fold PLP-dependent enzyme [Acidobacteriota bacterium]